jgi:hypothetical protein
MTVDFDELTEKLDEQASEIARTVDASDLEAKTIMEISRLVRHGHKCMDLTFRKDGKDYHFQADWIARLFRSKGERPMVGVFDTLTPEQQAGALAYDGPEYLGGEHTKEGYYEGTPEQNAAVERAQKIWDTYGNLWDLSNITAIQRCGVMNMLFKMQSAEHKHFGIAIPEGRFFVGQPTQSQLEEPGTGDEVAAASQSAGLTQNKTEAPNEH